MSTMTFAEPDARALFMMLLRRAFDVLGRLGAPIVPDHLGDFRVTISEKTFRYIPLSQDVERLEEEPTVVVVLLALEKGPQLVERYGFVRAVHIHYVGIQLDRVAHTTLASMTLTASEYILPKVSADGELPVSAL